MFLLHRGGAGYTMRPMRRSIRLTTLGLTLLATGIGIPFAAAGIQDRAMKRCTATPPGFPERLSRAGVGVAVDWQLARYRYVCVYNLSNGSVERHPPP